MGRWPFVLHILFVDWSLPLLRSVIKQCDTNGYTTLWTAIIKVISDL